MVALSIALIASLALNGWLIWLLVPKAQQPRYARVPRRRPLPDAEEQPDETDPEVERLNVRQKLAQRYPKLTAPQLDAATEEIARVAERELGRL